VKNTDEEFAFDNLLELLLNENKTKRLPGSMVTDNRICSRNFAVYSRLRRDTARKRAVFRPNPGYCNTAPYTTPYLCRIRPYTCRILVTNGCKTPTWIRVRYGA
jgi:hypothetical protein